MEQQNLATYAPEQHPSTAASTGGCRFSCISKNEGFSSESMQSKEETTSNAVLQFMRSPISSCFGMVGRTPSDQIRKGR